MTYYDIVVSFNTVTARNGGAVTVNTLLLLAATSIYQNLLINTVPKTNDIASYDIVGTVLNLAMNGSDSHCVNS